MIDLAAVVFFIFGAGACSGLIISKFLSFKGIKGWLWIAVIFFAIILITFMGLSDNVNEF